MDINLIIRTLHILSGTAWFGEIIVINFVLIPVLLKFNSETSNKFITTIFPRIFKLSSHLSIIAVLTGIHLVVSLSNANLSNLLNGRWGLSILIGGSLGILLTLFHFLVEKSLVKKISIIQEGDKYNNQVVPINLKVIQRINLVVITSILLLMINATRGIL